MKSAKTEHYFLWIQRDSSPLQGWYVRCPSHSRLEIHTESTHLTRHLRIRTRRIQNFTLRVSCIDQQWGWKGSLCTQDAHTFHTRELTVQSPHLPSPTRKRADRFRFFAENVERLSIRNAYEQNLVAHVWGYITNGYQYSNSQFKQLREHVGYSSHSGSLHTDSRLLPYLGHVGYRFMNNFDTLSAFGKSDSTQITMWSSDSLQTSSRFVGWMGNESAMLYLSLRFQTSMIMEIWSS